MGYTNHKYLVVCPTVEAACCEVAMIAHFTLPALECIVLCLQPDQKGVMIRRIEPTAPVHKVLSQYGVYGAIHCRA